MSPQESLWLGMAIGIALYLPLLFKKKPMYGYRTLLAVLWFVFWIIALGVHNRLYPNGSDLRWQVWFDIAMIGGWLFVSIINYRRWRKINPKPAKPKPVKP